MLAEPDRDFWHSLCRGVPKDRGCTSAGVVQSDNHRFPTRHPGIHQMGPKGVELLCAQCYEFSTSVNQLNRSVQHATSDFDHAASCLVAFDSFVHEVLS